MQLLYLYFHLKKRNTRQKGVRPNLVQIDPRVAPPSDNYDAALGPVCTNYTYIPDL